MSARKPCRLCSNTTFSEAEVCSTCRRSAKPEPDMPKGERVGGLVKKFVPYVAPWAPARTLGVVCDCGCLLISERESCPACFYWAVKNAEEFEQARQREANRGIVFDILAMRDRMAA